MILVIDNYDSFTYNLVQYVAMCGAEVEVRRNDAITLDEIETMGPTGILLSPGPSDPSSSGICLEILKRALNRLSSPIFGVCLGHQAIGHASGALIRKAGALRHGKTSPIRHDGRGVFESMPNPFLATRYHSLVIDRESLSAAFEVTATSDDDGEVMGIRHRSLPIEGVQFHPESILTEDGIRIVRNFVKSTERGDRS